MSLHPPTAICSGRLPNDNEEKERILLTNPETNRSAVYSTDQTGKQRPEWLFPRCPGGNMEYMIDCSLIITQHDEQNNLPHDLQVFRRIFDGFDDEELQFVVRIHAGDTALKRSLERAYFQKVCQYGIIVVVPYYADVADILEQHDVSEDAKDFVH